MASEDTLSFRILDTLVNAPSSVAGVYADLVYVMGFAPEQVVEPLRSAFDTLELRGWVIGRVATAGGHLAHASPSEKERCWTEYATWLPRAARGELAVDEIGLWYGLTEGGREAWMAFAGDLECAPWELDDDATKQVVSILAESREAAEHRLAEWLATRDGLTASWKEVSPVAQVQLRNGRTLASGVRLTCGYASVGT